jgi:hypothetical protein
MLLLGGVLRDPDDDDPDDAHPAAPKRSSTGSQRKKLRTVIALDGWNPGLPTIK